MSMDRDLAADSVGPAAEDDGESTSRPYLPAGNQSISSAPAARDERASSSSSTASDTLGPHLPFDHPRPPAPPAMATTLSPQDIKSLEQTRQRLSQLTTSLASLQHQIMVSDPLPPWASLHSQAQILSQTLASLASHLTQNAPLLNATAAYPLPSYPGREQEAMLGQLLRKKLEPRVEEWVEEGKAAGEGLAAGGGSERVREVKEMWEWAAATANEEARKYEWGVDEDEEDEESDEDEDVRDEGDEGEGKRKGNAGERAGEENKEEVKRPSMPLDDVLRFMMRGEEPRGNGGTGV